MDCPQWYHGDDIKAGTPRVVWGNVGDTSQWER